MPRRRPTLSFYLPWILLVALCLGALATSFALYQMQREGEGFAICRVAPGFDCAPALKSRYGRVFGIPLSSYAVAFYLFALAVSAQPLFRKKVAERNALLLSTLLAPGTLFCAWLAWVSLTRLKAYCPFCLVLHVLTPLMLVCSLWALARREHTLRVIVEHEWATIMADKRVGYGLIATALLVAIGLPLSGIHRRQVLLDSNPTYRQVLEGTYPRFDRLEELLGQRPMLGRPDAAVTIVEFADFTCPVCMQAKIAIEELLEVHDVRFIYVNVPKSRECNAAVDVEKPGACIAALVSQHARLRGDTQFWAVYEAVFGAPALLEESRADRLAQVAGAPDMATILADSAARAAIQEDLAIARMAGVQNVPSFFINGMGIEGLPDDWFLIEAVEREEDRARGR